MSDNVGMNKHSKHSFVYRLVFMFALLQLASPLTFAKSFSFGLGTSYENFAYKETLTAPAKSSETASFPMWLLEAKIFAPDNLSHLRLRYQFAQNINSNYDGADLNTGAPVTGTDILSFTDYEADVNLAFTNNIFFYIGYGYRVWDRFLAGSPGYREIYHWSYMPIGLVLWLGSPSFNYGVDVSMRPTTGGTIDVITSGTYANGQDSTMNLAPKTGYRFAIPFQWQLDPMMIGFIPWYEHSEIGQSNSTTNATLAPGANQVIVEPNSKTDRYGAELVLSYLF